MTDQHPGLHTVLARRALRKFALQPSDYRSHEEQEAAIESYLTWRNGSRDLGITAWTEFKRENAQAA